MTITMYDPETDLGISRAEFARREKERSRNIAAARRELLRQARAVRAPLFSIAGSPPGRLRKVRGHLRYEVVKQGITIPLPILTIQHGETR